MSKENFSYLICEGGNRTYLQSFNFVASKMLKSNRVSQFNEKTNKAGWIRFIQILTLSTSATETCYDCIDHIDSGQYLAECTGAKSHEGISGSVFSSRHQPSSPHWLQLPSHVNTPKLILVLCRFPTCSEGWAKVSI